MKGWELRRLIGGCVIVLFCEALEVQERHPQRKHRFWMAVGKGTGEDNMSQIHWLLEVVRYES
jgi:hypothetical protein